ncbi:hypothetical protein B0T22DRAFT_268705 [Podospora appendiculata]|uniref:Uncharacterized protein n=1 Tax=Podospora appendiculata TaxID=314037 RepID=A0AAE0X383_9PEZI|nr:hypothetical protein B0T22DRAFT_268705 [Podospora appendiculata]
MRCLQPYSDHELAASNPPNLMFCLADGVIDDLKWSCDGGEANGKESGGVHRRKDKRGLGLRGQHRHTCSQRLKAAWLLCFRSLPPNTARVPLTIPKCVNHRLLASHACISCCAVQSHVYKRDSYFSSKPRPLRRTGFPLPDSSHWSRPQTAENRTVLDRVTCPGQVVGSDAFQPRGSAPTVVVVIIIADHVRSVHCSQIRKFEMASCTQMISAKLVCAHDVSPNGLRLGRCAR